MDFIANNIHIAWLVLSLFCLIVELTTGGLYIMCFAIGAIFTCFISWFCPNFEVQVVSFCLSSLLCIFFARPALKKSNFFNVEDKKSNADAVVNQIGRVTEDIMGSENGWVLVYGDYWKARSLDSTTIEKGKKIKVVSRESSTLVVTEIK